MAEFIKNKFVTVIMVVATLILAGVAIFTALRLYQLRNESISPTSPESRPAADTQKRCEGLSFVISTQTPTITTAQTVNVTTTVTPTITSSVTSTPSPTQSVTSTPGPTATSTPGPTATPSGGTGGAGTALPDAGISLPTIALGIIGTLLISLAVILAL